MKRAFANTIAAFTGATGINAAIDGMRRRKGVFRVLVLEYHEIGSGGEMSFGAIDVERFRSQMRYVSERYRCVSLAEAVLALTGRSSLFQDVVCVTFDDGYLGNYRNAWPVLRDLHIPLTVFVTTDFLDGKTLWFDRARALVKQGASEPAAWHEIRQRLRDAGCFVPVTPDEEAALAALKSFPHADRTKVVDELWQAFGQSLPTPAALGWEEVRELLEEGVEIGAHTVTHPILSGLDIDTQRAEVERARDRIREMTGVAPRFFAYPNGSEADFTAVTQRLVAEAGFEAAVSTIRGANYPGSTDMFAIRRLGVGPDSNSLLQARLTGLFDQAVRRLAGVS